MNYKIDFPNSFKDLKIFYLVNNNINLPDYNLQYIKSAGEWFIYNNSGTLHSVPDLSTLTEEEYFLESLIWDYVFPIEIALKIMTLSRKCKYNFIIVKCILLRDGIVE